MKDQAETSFIKQFEQRKKDHITLALKPENEAIGYSGLNTIELIHNALPEINFDEVTTEAILLGKKSLTPFIVSSMTAGHEQAILINSRLAEACQTMGWIMGVGSQRRQIIDSTAYTEWSEIRKNFPKTRLIGNIGLTQLIHSSTSSILKILEPLEAEGIFIHTNPLQECIQPEGTPNFKGGLKSLEKLCKELSLPVILKETGCGFSLSTLKSLKNIGLHAVDVSGYGGTHWGRIEGARAEKDITRQQAAQTFRAWGIDTVTSVLNALDCNSDYRIWASGGVRSGLDAAKLIAMGAEGVGFARPMLESAILGYEALISTMKNIQFELKMALFCTGNKNIQSFQENKVWLKKIP